MRSPALDSGERSPFMTPRSGKCPFQHEVVLLGPEGLCGRVFRLMQIKNPCAARPWAVCTWKKVAELKLDSSFKSPFALVLIDCSPFYYDGTQI